MRRGSLKRKRCGGSWVGVPLFALLPASQRAIVIAQRCGGIDVTKHSVRILGSCLAVMAQAIALIGLNAPAIAAGPQTFSDAQIGEMQDVVSRNGNAFGGLVADQSTHIVTIYLAPSLSQAHRSSRLADLGTVGSTADPLVSAAPKRWSLRIATSGPSLAVLDGVVSRVKSNQRWRENLGDNLISFGVDPSLHAVVVGVETITAKVIADARSAFGNLVVVKKVERQTRLSRLLDAKPYWGGDRLVLYPEQCTAGFVAIDTRNGDRGMLSAGHCFYAGATVKQGYIDSGGLPIQQAIWARSLRYPSPAASIALTESSWMQRRSVRPYKTMCTHPPSTPTRQP